MQISETETRNLAKNEFLQPCYTVLLRITTGMSDLHQLANF